jgi:hypothetical protein
MFYGYLKRRLKRQYWEVIDDILFDMRACADNRAVFGKTDNFYEEVFQIYRAGGWPCGWVGRFPDGVFAVYVPTAEFDRIGKGQ